MTGVTLPNPILRHITNRLTVRHAPANTHRVLRGNFLSTPQNLLGRREPLRRLPASPPLHSFADSSSTPRLFRQVPDREPTFDSLYSRRVHLYTSVHLARAFPPVNKMALQPG